MGLSKKKWYRNHSLLKRISAGFVFVICVIAAVYWGVGRNAQAQSETGETYYTVVKRGDIRVSASGSGTLEASNQISLSFPTAGIVSEVKVTVGDTVRAGDVLARIGDTTELEADLAAAKLNLVEVQQAFDDLTSNAQANIAAAYQAYAEAQAAYTEALRLASVVDSSRCSRSTNQKLYDTYYRAQDQLALAAEGTEEYINLKQALATAEANLQYCLTYTDSEKESASANLTLTQLQRDSTLETYTQLKELGGIDPDEVTLAEDKVTAAQNAVNTAQANFDGATMTAPIDGTILTVASGVGETVNGSTFITMADLSEPMVSVYVDESDLDMMTTGNQAEITFDAIPDRIFDGELIQVDPQIISQGSYSMISGLVQITSDLSALNRVLPIGLNAAVDVISQQSKDVLLVNKQALRDLGDGTTVVFVQRDGQLRLQVVEVGLTDDTYAEITSGLNEGDIVSTGIVETN